MTIGCDCAQRIQNRRFAIGQCAEEPVGNCPYAGFDSVQYGRPDRGDPYAKRKCVDE